MERYKNKENYITRDPNPDVWRNHPNALILKRYKNEIKGNVLDFGCNHGSCTFLILENKNVKSVIGLDLNYNAIKIAYQTKKELYKDSKIEFIVANIINYTTKKLYDTIVSFHTLEHIYPEDIDSVINKLYNILNKNGYLLISIPYEMAYNDPKQHVAFYNENSLSDIMNRNGFETINCYMDTECGDSGILTGLFIKK